MKRALVIQHMNHDHPGRFADFFAEDGIIPEFVRLWAGQPIPDVSGFDLLFSCGGPQDVWQDDEYPWLAVEREVIREWVLKLAKPFIGICLGHQLLAEAVGGTVGRAEHSELGLCEVAVTKAGQAHPLMQGIPAVQKVMQFHFAEVKTCPEVATVLQSSDKCRVQSIGVDRHAIGTQYHCEHTAQTYAGWGSQPDMQAYLLRHRGPGATTALMRESFPQMADLHANTRRLYENLVSATGLRR